MRQQLGLAPANPPDVIRLQDAATPTALVGPTAITGVAKTWMRSDGAPAINSTAAYTWTGLHTFSAGLSATTGTFSGVISASNLSGTNTGDQNLSGYALLSGATFTGALSGTTATFSSSVQLGAPTGGALGAGKINVTGGYYLNGVALPTAAPSSANPSAVVGPTAVNGTAATFMTSDSAPAINLNAAYQWAGSHTWNMPGAGAAMYLTNGSGSASGFNITNSGANYGIYVSNGSNGAGIYVSNGYSASTGIYISNGGTGVGLSCSSSGTGAAITASNSSTGYAINVTGGPTNLQALTATTGTFSGAIIRSSTAGGWLSGNYSSAETGGTAGAIYSIGGSYAPNGGGANPLGTMYGIGYTLSQTVSGGSGSTTIATVTGAPTSNWGMYVASGGSASIFLDASNGGGYFAGPISATTGTFSGALSAPSGTIGNVVTGAPNYGSFGSIGVAGSTNGYAGISFSAASVTLMASNTVQGFLVNNSGWEWQFQNGALTIGTVPGASVTGSVTSATTATNQSGGTVAATTMTGTNLSLSGTGSLIQVGSTKYSWYSNQYAIDIGTGGSIIGDTIGTVGLTNNLYVNASDVWAYKTAGTGAIYELTSGGHYWYTVPSGSAGATASPQSVMYLANGGGLSSTLNSSAYAATSGAVPGFIINNTNSGMQTCVEFQKNGTVCGRLRSDYAGNISYVATASGVHSFFTGGDSGSGTSSVTISSTGLKVGTSASTNQAGDLGVCRNAAASTGAIYFGTSGADYIYYTGSAWSYTGGAWTASSDGRLKKNISPIPHALDFIKSIKGVNFDWIRNDNPGVGVIAQDVEAMMPGLVHLGMDDTKCVDYNGIVACLVEAVKEQQTQIEQLQRKAA